MCSNIIFITFSSIVPNFSKREKTELSYKFITKTNVFQTWVSLETGDTALVKGRGRLRPVWGVGEAPPDPVPPVSTDSGMRRVTLNGYA